VDGIAARKGNVVNGKWQRSLRIAAIKLAVVIVNLVVRVKRMWKTLGGG
jgi:hypothetical protein